MIFSYLCFRNTYSLNKIRTICLMTGVERSKNEFQFRFHAVGFHRYALENFTGNTFEGLKEQELTEFDPPTEVCKLKCPL